MTEPQWITVWLQGGPANDFRYETLVEPPDEIVVMADPFNDDNFIRVVGPWDGATTYRRVRQVEQFDRERIFYPVEDG